MGFDTGQNLQSNQFIQLYRQNFRKSHSWTAIAVIIKLFKTTPRPVGAWKERFAINAVALLVYVV